MNLRSPFWVLRIQLAYTVAVGFDVVQYLRVRQITFAGDDNTLGEPARSLSSSAQYMLSDFDPSTVFIPLGNLLSHSELSVSFFANMTFSFWCLLIPSFSRTLLLACKVDSSAAC